MMVPKDNKNGIICEDHCGNLGLNYNKEKHLAFLFTLICFLPISKYTGVHG